MARAMRLHVRPFGVLGTALTSNGIKKMMAEPPPGLPVVDPAGLHHIRNGPKGASGAAGQIYRWLGIAGDDAFPEPVRTAIQRPLQAKLHFYGPKACLHVVGPDFRDRKLSHEEALEELSVAYGAVLREFAKSSLGGLRMLPISGGIFSGPFAADLPLLSCRALRKAFDSLPNGMQRVVSVSRLDMCIFMETEYEAFVEAFKEETDRAQQFTASMGVASSPTRAWQTDPLGVGPVQS